MRNFEIAKILYTISSYEDLKGEMFKSRAYQRAAHSIESMDKEVSEIYRGGGKKALMEIPGIGEGIAKKIAELLETGKLKYFEEIKKKLPVDLENLMKKRMPNAEGPKIAVEMVASSGTPPGASK